MAGSRVPAALRTRIGDDATFGLIELVDAERKEWSEAVLNTAADRFERRLAEELSQVRVEMRDGLASCAREIRQEMHAGQQALVREIASTRVDMLKWAFLFWVGQLGAVAALLAFMLRGVR